MFKQNPHPFYTALLKNDYIIIQQNNTLQSNYNAFSWYCGGYKLLVSQRLGSLDIYDSNKGINFSFPVNSGFKNDIEGIKFSIDSYVYKIKNSLDSKSILAMELIIFEIIQNYKNIKSVDFSVGDVYNEKFVRMIDQDENFYKIIGKNIYNFIHNFYFINNISLDTHLSIEEPSNHQILENFIKYKNLKKELKINPKIKIIS